MNVKPALNYIVHVCIVSEAANDQDAVVNDDDEDDEDDGAASLGESMH